MSDKSGNKQLHYLFIHKGLTIIGIGIHIVEKKIHPCFLSFRISEFLPVESNIRTSVKLTNYKNWK